MDEMLSIIIPCYNCTATLEEAVESVYVHELQIPFEIVMVDDGSTDSTRDVIVELSRKHPEIRYTFHRENLGGGAARNTAVEHSEGDLIFCLDSDDMLTPGMLSRMVDCLLERECDGVGISKSIKFRGRNTNRISYITDFDYVGQRIPFESLLDGSNCALYSTFLHTRHSYQMAGGYPTDHGFDTQGFAFRFLANGLVAYTCPDTVYLHRVDFHESYYVREYTSGKAAYNWFKICEEFLFLFDNRVKEEILSFDIYRDTSHQQTLKEAVQGHKDHLYAPTYAQLIQPHIIERTRARLSERIDECDQYDCYWLGWAEQRRGNYERAVDHFSQAILLGLDSIHAYKYLVRSLCYATGCDYSDVVGRIAEEEFTPNRFGLSLPAKVKAKLGVTLRRAVGALWTW